MQLFRRGGLGCNCRRQCRTAPAAAPQPQLLWNPLALGCLAGVLLQLHPPAAAAYIPIDKFQANQVNMEQIMGGFDPAAAASSRAAPPVYKRPGPSNTSSGAAAITSTSNSSSRSSSEAASGANARPSRGATALAQLQAAQAVAAEGRWLEALELYNVFLAQYSDLALAEYARLGKALALYEVGQVSSALLLLEDQEVAMRGSPEVHAALAAMLYAERPAQRFRAEQQFDIAVDFDRRYESAEWVQQHRTWPPRLLSALQAFLQLQ